MSVPARDLYLSIDEYLKLEEQCEVRHEFVGGRVFAMVGATQAHNSIVSNLLRLLYDRAAECGCRIYSSDMKVWIEATQTFYYPDIVVTCEPFDAKSVFSQAPSLIAEVISPSTVDVDHREKLIAYRKLPSLQEYMLVYQDEMRVEVYRKDTDGGWSFNVYMKAGRVELQALPLLDVDMLLLYRGVISPDE